VPDEIARAKKPKNRRTCLTVPISNPLGLETAATTAFVVERKKRSKN